MTAAFPQSKDPFGLDITRRNTMTSNEKKQLQITACKVRMGVIESTHGAKRNLVAPLWSGDKKRVLNYLNKRLTEIL